MNRLKNLFIRSNDKLLKTGDLYTNKKNLLAEAAISVDEEKFVFKSNATTLNFNYSDIISLDYKNKSLIFVYKSQKYVFISNADLEDIYNDVLPKIGVYECLFDATGKYSIYNTVKDSFDEVEELVDVKIIKDSVYYLKIETPDAVLHLEEISSNTQYYMDQKNTTFVWSVSKDNLFYTFALKFMDTLTFLNFLSRYVSGLYKNTNVGKKIVPEENEKYFEKMEVENYSALDEELENEEEEYYDYESCDDGELENPFGEATEKNNHLVTADNMAFVTRGGSVGVFENDNNGLKFKSNIKNVLEKDVDKIIPHDKSKSLIYLTKEERDKLSKLDLERGEVVETWKFDRDLNDYFDSKKMVNDGTLVGLSDYSVFRIDPRTKEKIVESKDYKTKNEFNSGVATSKGHVVVSGKNGDLRLYDSVNKRAKSLLPGFGDEIRHIDVTSDGKHILSTCKNYLMLTTVPGNYSLPVGKEKPVPKRLQLKPQHLSFINEEVNFTPAKFSTDRSEDKIITSTGHYVIVWKLKDVLEGRLYDYQISRCNDIVVADNFDFGNDGNIVVTMPDDVKRVDSGILKRPSKKFFK